MFYADITLTLKTNPDIVPSGVISTLKRRWPSITFFISLDDKARKGTKPVVDIRTDRPDIDVDDLKDQIADEIEMIYQAAKDEKAQTEE